MKTNNLFVIANKIHWLSKNKYLAHEISWKHREILALPIIVSAKDEKEKKKIRETPKRSLHNEVPPLLVFSAGLKPSLEFFAT